MRTTYMTAALAALATAATLHAQTPQTQPPQTPQTQPPTSRPSDRQQPTTDSQRQTAGQTITITGCLKEEKDVAGARPSVTERAGMGEDYILTNAKMSGSSTVSGMALATQYKIEGISDSELKRHLNHQVEVTGTISQSGQSGRTGMSGTGSAGTTGSGSTGSTGSGSTGSGSAGSGSTGSGSTSGTGGAGSMGSGSHAEFRGTTMKMIAATCQDQK